jgi:hypothetical protein
MINFNWSIKSLEYTNDTNKGVLIAQWSLVAEDGEYTAQSNGFSSFTPNPEDDSYVAYEDLTEEIVISWIKDSLGEEGVQEKQSVVANKIEEQKKPKTEIGLPFRN